MFLSNCAAPTLLPHSRSSACASTCIWMEPWQGRVCLLYPLTARSPLEQLESTTAKNTSNNTKNYKELHKGSTSHYAYLCLFVLVLCYTGRWSLVGRADFCQTKEASFATTPTAPSPGALFSRLISLAGRESHHTDFLNGSAPDGFCSAPHK